MIISSQTTDLARLLQHYFCSYLINQRRVSSHTIASYRDAFRLLLPFIAGETNKPVSALIISDINSQIVLAFLHHLEEKRNNTIQTRNARLSAIRSFLNYVVIEEPSALADVQPVLALPEKKADHYAFEYLEKDEMKAILNVHDLTTWTGQRDHVLLLTLYNTGARVSEITDVQMKDVDLSNRLAIHLHGKGRKERVIPLWPKTVIELRNWKGRIDKSSSAPVFPNRHGCLMTRFGLGQRLECAVKKASDIQPSLKGRKITPHAIRHTTAMHLLQSGVDLSVIALWLGHEKIETTHQYMEANLELKRQALDKLKPGNEVSSKKQKKLTEDILAFLESL